MDILGSKYRPKISIRELEQEKPSSLMKKYNMSERQLQQEVVKHAGTENQRVQRAVYETIYGKKPGA